jgi:hypothetical protein
MQDLSQVQVAGVLVAACRPPWMNSRADSSDAWHSDVSSISTTIQTSQVLLPLKTCIWNEVQVQGDSKALLSLSLPTLACSMNLHTTAWAALILLCLLN